jgi:hypothetical protein
MCLYKAGDGNLQFASFKEVGWAGDRYVTEEIHMNYSLPQYVES